MKRWFIISAILTLIIGGPVFLFSCKHDSIAPPVTPLNFINPAGFPNPVYNFQNNPLTVEAFLLGRKLFYDGRLSLDGNYPCASCHQPVAAFTTFEHDRSHGYNHSHTQRNAPALFNLAWYPAFNQDGGEQNLESVFRKHITNPNEMAESVDHVISKLKNDPVYRQMFFAAFGDNKVTSDRIYKALSQFLINLVSSSSKYDRVKRGEDQFSPEEQMGYAVFQTKCSTCHAEPLFTDFSYRNIGLPIDPSLNDYGRFRVTGNPADSFKFRTPSLRNNDFTSYYTHDGRFSLPRNVIQHYRTGVVPSSTLDPLLVGGMTLTNTEENNLVFFLRTLSDSAFLNNSRFKE